MFNVFNLYSHRIICSTWATNANIRRLYTLSLMSTFHYLCGCVLGLPCCYSLSKEGLASSCSVHWLILKLTSFRFYIHKYHAKYRLVIYAYDTMMSNEFWHPIANCWKTIVLCSANIRKFVQSHLFWLGVVCALDGVSNMVMDAMATSYIP